MNPRGKSRRAKPAGTTRSILKDCRARADATSPGTALGRDLPAGGGRAVRAVATAAARRAHRHVGADLVSPFDGLAILVHDAWRRLRSGDRRIAVGARSALFAPLAGLGVNDLAIIRISASTRTSFWRALTTFHERKKQPETWQKVDAFLSKYHRWRRQSRPMSRFTIQKIDQVGPDDLVSNDQRFGQRIDHHFGFLGELGGALVAHRALAHVIQCQAHLIEILRVPG